MLTSKKVVDAINKQIGNEFGASMQSVAIAAYFSGDALPQLAEERSIEYTVDAGGRVVIEDRAAGAVTLGSGQPAAAGSLSIG